MIHLLIRWWSSTSIYSDSEDFAPKLIHNHILFHREESVIIVNHNLSELLSIRHITKHGRIRRSGRFWHGHQYQRWCKCFFFPKWMLLGFAEISRNFGPILNWLDLWLFSSRSIWWSRPFFGSLYIYLIHKNKLFAISCILAKTWSWKSRSSESNANHFCWHSLDDRREMDFWETPSGKGER